MFRVFQILVITILTAALTGCGQQQEKPIWEGLKIGDLAPILGPSPIPAFKTIAFDVHIIDIPAMNIDILDQIWTRLQERQIQFDNANVFKANSFIARFGQLPVWDDIRELLIVANGKKLKTSTLIIPVDQSENLPIKMLYDRQTIFYVSNEGVMEGTDIGPGSVVLRLNARNIGNQRGTCQVKIEPVYSPPRTKFASKTKRSRRKGEIFFDGMAFNLDMSDGDFVLLGPEKYEKYRITLSSLFFSKDKPRETVRIYLIVCTKINE
ncbi:MAG: hypothetical protein FVQ80_10095 [Planctomycetes bacterium]|nr:hypothetical protein [Planctomycetota bacterium]